MSDNNSNLDNSASDNSKFFNPKDYPISKIIFGRKIQFWKLFKATFIFSVAPLMIIATFILNDILNLEHGALLFSCIFLLAMLFIHPYVADLAELNEHVTDMSENADISEKPYFSFLSNFTELGDAIDRLNNSWKEKNENLEALIEEDKEIIDALPDMIFLVDHKLEILSFNKTTKDYLGENYLDFVNKILKDEVIIANIIKSSNEVKGNGFLYEIKAKEKFIFNVVVKRFPKISLNRFAFMLVFQDITPLKKSEIMLTDFVANASHEMKTPLASILGYSETILEGGVDEEHTEKFITTIKDQGVRLRNILNDLLILSKVESGVGKKDFSEINFNEIILSAVSSLQPTAEEHKVKINTNFHNQEFFFLGNYNEVRVLTENLLSNAIKYNKPSGKVDINVSFLENNPMNFENFSPSQNFALLEITDEGEGIANDMIPRITERFFRVDKSRSREEGGNGIGLSIVKHVAENHNAVLKIESELGKGSVFRVYFPV